MFNEPNCWPHASNQEQAPGSYVQATFQARVLHDALVDTRRFPQSSVEDVLLDLKPSDVMLFRCNWRPGALLFGLNNCWL